MKRLLVFFIALIILPTIQAQDDIPYIYYYSHLYGGIIIERADGTDSRIIANNLIPPDAGGIQGAGWSPNGQYFAGFQYGKIGWMDSPVSSFRRFFLFDTNGYDFTDNTHFSIDDILLKMQLPKEVSWSPNSKYLLIWGWLEQRLETPTTPAVFWLINIEEERIVSEFVFTINPFYGGGLSKFQWTDTEVIFDVQWYEIEYKRVQMNYDGTVVQTSITQSDFRKREHSPITNEELINGISTSPRGRYTTYGNQLTDTDQDTVKQLIYHSQETQCRIYRWHPSEQYFIRYGGNIVSGGGCDGAVTAVGSVDGTLWREINNCGGNWLFSEIPCFGWLPITVEIDQLPIGQPNPIQLDAVNFESDKTSLGPSANSQVARFRCKDSYNFEIVDRNRDQNLYQLQSIYPCPVSEYQADFGAEVVFAYNENTQILATAIGDGMVNIWRIDGKDGVLVDRLNTLGYELQFTKDNEFLRARNVRGWKIYSVADILEHAEHSPIAVLSD